MKRTLVQRFLGDVRLVVRSASRPDTKEFDDHVAEVQVRNDSTRVVLVAYVGDGADVCFDAEHRSKLYRAGAFSKPHAVLAPPVRPEIIVSMRWLGAHIRPFGPHAFDEACEFLEIPVSQRATLYDALASARLQVADPVQDARRDDAHAVAPIRAP